MPSSERKIERKKERERERMKERMNERAMIYGNERGGAQRSGSKPWNWKLKLVSVSQERIYVTNLNHYYVTPRFKLPGWPSHGVSDE